MGCGSSSKRQVVVSSEQEQARAPPPQPAAVVNTVQPRAHPASVPSTEVKKEAADPPKAASQAPTSRPEPAAKPVSKPAASASAEKPATKPAVPETKAEDKTKPPPESSKPAVIAEQPKEKPPAAAEPPIAVEVQPTAKSVEKRVEKIEPKKEDSPPVQKQTATSTTVIKPSANPESTDTGGTKTVTTTITRTGPDGSTTKTTETRTVKVVQTTNVKFSGDCGSTPEDMMKKIEELKAAHGFGDMQAISNAEMPPDIAAKLEEMKAAHGLNSSQPEPAKLPAAEAKQQAPPPVAPAVTEQKPAEVPKSAPKPKPPVPKRSGQGLPDLVSFEFVPEETKVVPGSKSTQHGGSFGGDTSSPPVIDDGDTIRNICFVSQFYQNGCFTDGRYNALNWKTERGRLQSSTGTSYEAYRISPPQNPAQQFLGCHHHLYYKFPEQSEVQVLVFSGTSLAPMTKIAPSAASTKGFAPVPDADMSKLETDVVYVFADATAYVSAMTVLGDGVEGAKIHSSDKVDISCLIFDVGAQPYIPEDFSGGPDSHDNVYGQRRNFFLIQEGPAMGVFWQDKDQGTGHLTWIRETDTTFNTVDFNLKGNYILGSATAGDPGEVYYFLIQEGDAGDKLGSRQLFMVRANSQTGQELDRQPVDGSKEGLNVYKASHSCTLAYNGAHIGLHLSRTMTRSGDGLNHQGAIAVVFDKTLHVVKNHGQTSGHSFGDSLTIASNNEFVGIDLGDNYPRGINLWRFNDASRMQTQVVYTYKTSHGEKPTNSAGKPFDPYPEISGSGKTFYKWSNDNKTYTELAAPGLAEIDNAFTVFFVGEKPALDNSLAGEYINAARNIGFVKISKDFSQFLSPGGVETGGFYDFGGEWSAQKNEGIVWLTNNRNMDQDNVSRLKTARLGENRNLLVFEKWNKKAWLSSHCAIADDNGRFVTTEVEVAYPFRLHRSDDMFDIGGRAVWFEGKRGGKIAMYTAELKS